MKKKVHPDYQQILFVDSASGHRFVCGSTLKPAAKELFEGVEYPVCYVSISSASHPFFTGSKQLVDSEGRVEKFKKRFGTSKYAEKTSEVSSDASAQAARPASVKVESAQKAPSAAKAAPAKAAPAKGAPAKAAPAKAAPAGKGASAAKSAKPAPAGKAPAKGKK